MLNWPIIRTVLIVHFSSQSLSPLFSVVKKLLVGGFIAIFFGSVLAKAVRGAILPFGFPDTVIFCLSLAIGFIIGGFVVMAMNSIGNQSSVYGYSGILKMLGITKFSRWMAMEIPIIIILSFVGVFGSLVINSAATVMLASNVIAISGWLLGLFSGYGCLLIRLKKRNVSYMLFISIVISTGMLFDNLLQATVDQNNRTIMVICLILLAPILGHWQLYRRGLSIGESAPRHLTRSVIPNVIPYWGWYLVKLWRNKRTKGSLLIALTLSFSSALVIIARGKAVIDPYQLLFFTAILSATFACDVRGVIARYCPPEIIQLSGVGGLVKSELIAVTTLGLVIGAPLLLALISYAVSPITFIVMYFSIQLFASVVGLMMSTILVPRVSDTASQFMSAALAISSIFLLPRVASFSDKNAVEQLINWLVVSALAMVLIYIIELNRRRKYGGA